MAKARRAPDWSTKPSSRQRSEQYFFPVLAVIDALQSGLEHGSECPPFTVNGSLARDVMLGSTIAAVGSVRLIVAQDIVETLHPVPALKEKLAYKTCKAIG
jgi:hypothetical protein